MGTQLLGVGLDLCWPPCPPMDLAEREQALQRCCVELDERERRWKIAGAVSRLAAAVPVSPWAGGGPAGLGCFGKHTLRLVIQIVVLEAGQRSKQEM